MSTYREVLEAKNKPHGAYLMTFTGSEERGGSSKPTGLIAAKRIEDLPDPTQFYESQVYEVRNGVLFEMPIEKLYVDDNCEYPFVGGAMNGMKIDFTAHGRDAIKVLEKEFRTDSYGWWSLFGVGDDGEELCEDEDIGCPASLDHGYVLIITEWCNITGVLVERKVFLSPNFSKVFGAFNGSNFSYEGYMMDIYKLEKGKARLLISNAPIHVEPRLNYTGFSCYDTGINTHKKCNNECLYCYGAEMEDVANLDMKIMRGRVAIGTHCDPYDGTSPGGVMEIFEKICQFHTKRREQRKSNDDNEISKVGIFTKNTQALVKDIRETFKKIKSDSWRMYPLEYMDFHINISPFDEVWRKKLEKHAPTNANRLKGVTQLRKLIGPPTDIYDRNYNRIILNICPCIPGITTEDVLSAGPLMDAYDEADEICIGLLCLYGNIPNKLQEVLSPETMELLMTRTWEEEFIRMCRRIFHDQMHKKLVVWRDRTRTGWKRLSDMTPLPQEYYLSPRYGGIYSDDFTLDTTRDGKFHTPTKRTRT